MSKDCAICGYDTNGFFIWSTDRYFNFDKFIRAKKKLEGNLVTSFGRDGDPVCFGCIEKYRLRRGCE